MGNSGENSQDAPTSEKSYLLCSKLESQHSFETVYILSINLLFTFTVSECTKIVLTCLQWCIKISKIKKEKKNTLFHIFETLVFKGITVKNKELLRWGNLFLFKINVFSLKDFQNLVRGNKQKTKHRNQEALKKQCGFTHCQEDKSVVGEKQMRQEMEM